jgi:D-alanine-D-alanine ligase
MRSLLPVIEIQAPGGNYDYQNKYFGTRDPVSVPGAAVGRDRDAGSAGAGVEAYRALDCEGWGRADLMLVRRRHALGCSRSTPRRA